jgi:multiple sugar transport system permease protein
MVRRRNIFCLAMVAPTMVLVLLLGIYPMLDSLRLSVLRYDLISMSKTGTPFVGLENFRTLLGMESFTRSFLNTLMYGVLVTAGLLILGLVVASVMNVDYRGRGLVRALFLVPWVIPPVIAAAIWMQLLRTETSPFNQILMNLGLIRSNIAFLTDSRASWGPLTIPFLAVLVVRLWHGIPFTSVMLLAGLQSISHDLYEAAEIDGASAIGKFRYVTLPMLRPLLVVVSVLLLISAVGHFELIYVLTRGGPANLTNVIAVFSYTQAFGLYRFDLAAAASTVILLISSIVAVYYVRAKILEARGGQG